MATKKGASSSSNGRDSESKRLGVKRFGGQQVNQVLSQSAQDVAEGFSYLPFQVYANSIYNDTVGQAYANKSSLDDGIAAWQSKLVEYGNAQGFTVSE